MVGGMFELSPAEVRESERAQQQQLQTQMRAIERAAAPLNDRETRDLMAGVRNYAREHPNATTSQLAQEGLSYLQRMRDEGTAFGSTPARENRIRETATNLFEQGVLANMAPGQESTNFADFIRRGTTINVTPTDMSTILNNLEQQKSRTGPLTPELASISMVRTVGQIASNDSSAYARLSVLASNVGMPFAREETQRAGTSEQGHGTINVLNAVLQNHAPDAAEYVRREIETRRLGDRDATQLAVTTLENLRGVMDPQTYQDARANVLGFALSRGIETQTYRTGTNDMPILR